MSGNSNVGSGGVYEAGDQRNSPNSEKAQNQAQPYEEGKPNSHNEQDSKDQRSISNRLAAAAPQNDSTTRKDLSAEDKAAQDDPTAPARMHGNEPSKGAKIDKELEDEEAEMIRKKDEAKAQRKK